MMPLKYSMNLDGCLEVPRRGRAGGLCLLWDSDTKVKVTLYSNRHIDAIIESREQEPWRFTGIYGYSDGVEKHKTWNLIQLFDVGQGKA